MRTFTLILLGLGIFLITLQVASILEYYNPGSVSWIPKEVDWWYYKFWSVTIFIILLLLAVAIIGWALFKGIPALIRITRHHWPAILAVASKVTSNPIGRKVILTIGVLIIGFILIVIIIGGFWFLSLFF